MDIKHLEIFIGIAESGSFSKTAEKLFLTQPTISANIAQLEEELGTKLIVRSAGGATLTDDGVLLYSKAVEVVKIREEIFGLFKLSNERNIINIGASTQPAHYMVPEILSEYSRNCPQVQFNVVNGRSEDIIRKIDEKKVDLAVVGNCPKQLDAYDCTRIFRDKLIIIMPNTDYYRRLLDAPQKTILKEPIIMRETVGRRMNKYLSSIGVDPNSLNITAKMNEQELIKRSVAGGMGISIMTKSISDDYAAMGKILQLELSEGDVYRDIYLIRLKNRSFNKTISNFADFLINYYAAQQSATKN